MKQSIVHVALLVRDDDEAIALDTKKLHFTVVEDTYQPEQEQRWVLVAPSGFPETTILLARASTTEQALYIGNQTGGRVFLFLRTDDFWRDYHEMVSVGIHFVRNLHRASTDFDWQWRDASFLLPLGHTPSLTRVHAGSVSCLWV